MFAAGFLHVPQRFSIVPPLQPDELLSSWVLRIGAYYGLGWEWPKLIMDGLAPHLDNPLVRDRAAFFLDIKPPSAALERLAGFTGYTIDHLRGHTLVAVSRPEVAWHYAGIRSTWGDSCPSSPAYCVGCLAEMMKDNPAGMYLRRSWASTYRTVCPRHLIGLKDFGWIGNATPRFEWRPAGRTHLRIPGTEVEWPVCPADRKAVALLADAEDAVAATLSGETVSFAGHLCGTAELMQVIEDLADWCGQVPARSTRPLLHHIAPTVFSRKVSPRETIDPFNAAGLHEQPVDCRRPFLGTLLAMLSAPDKWPIFYDFSFPNFAKGLDRLFVEMPLQGDFCTLLAKADTWPPSITTALREAADRHIRRQREEEARRAELAQRQQRPELEAPHGEERDGRMVPLRPPPIPKGPNYGSLLASIDAILADPAITAAACHKRRAKALTKEGRCGPDKTEAKRADGREWRECSASLPRARIPT